MAGDDRDPSLTTDAAAPAVVAIEPQLPARYVLLERLGEGGMGVVYTAYDRDLDRKVAVKVVRGDAAGDSDGGGGLVREAQALARLHHPNVVAVYDVGATGDRFFVTMERVEGQSLRRWLDAPRGWREIVRVFLAAGQGLAAAHAAGLVHRDFKPDNVLVGADGRVRVADFGLARPASEASRPPADSPAISPASGTPHYMAPEQREGRGDARADQYSFCVALDDALGTAAPRHVRAAVQRGRAGDPAARFADLPALLAALARDPGAQLRRVLAAAAVVAAAVAIPLLAGSRGESPCSGAGEKLAGVWGAERGAALRAAFLATGKPWAASAADRVTARLDEQARAYAAAFEGTCLAARRGEQSADVRDTRMACLDERLQHLRAVSDLLVAADADMVTNADRAVAGLADVGDCADPATWSAAMRLPRDPAARARIATASAQMNIGVALMQAGKRAAAGPLLEAATREADAIGHAPLSAEVAFRRGQLATNLGDTQGAVDSYLRAVLAAEAAGMDRTVAQAAAELAWCTEGKDKLDDGRRWGRFARAVATRIGDEAEIAHAEFVLGEVELAAGRYDEAERHDREALDRWRKLGSLDVPRVENALGIVAQQRNRSAEAAAWFSRALEDVVRLKGPDHPGAASAGANLGIALGAAGRYDEATRVLARAMAVNIGARGADHPSTAQILISMSQVQGHLDRAGESLASVERALAILAAAKGVDRWALFVAGYQHAKALLSAGRTAEARRIYDEAAALQQELVGDDHATWPETLELAARIERAEGHPDAARRSLARAVAAIEKFDGATGARLVSHLPPLAALELSEAHHEAARDLAARAIAVAEQHGIEDDPDLNSARVTLGRALLALRQPAAAVPPLEQVAASMARRPPQNLEERGMADDARIALATARRP